MRKGLGLEFWVAAVGRDPDEGRPGPQAECYASSPGQERSRGTFDILTESRKDCKDAQDQKCCI